MTRVRRPSAQTTVVVLALADRGLLETTWDTDAPAGRPPVIGTG